MDKQRLFGLDREISSTALTDPPPLVSQLYSFAERQDSSRHNVLFSRPRNSAS